MKNIFFFLFLIPIFLFAQAPITTFQEVKYLDEVNMKNGSVYNGKIIEMGENVIVIDVLGGFRLHLNRDNIRNIRQKCLNCANVKENTGFNYRFKEKGIYHHISVGLVSATDDLGLNASYSIGKMQRRAFGFGGGLGISLYEDSYSSAKFNFIPIFAETRSYIFAKRNTPFVTAKAGYGFALKRTLNGTENQVISKQSGGLFFNPSFGFRFGANEDINLTMDLGFLMQYSKDVFLLDDTGLGTSWRKRVFRRWSFNLGIVF